jgi:hypothetical protein
MKITRLWDSVPGIWCQFGKISAYSYDASRGPSGIVANDAIHEEVITFINGSRKRWIFVEYNVENLISLDVFHSF